MQRRSMLAGVAGTALAPALGVHRVRAAEKPIRIGVLADLSGSLSDISGQGTVAAARMAVEDMGGSVLGRPIEVRVGDIQQKVDIGVSIARQWLDDGVDALVDIPNSAVALAVQDLVRDRKRVALMTGAGSAELTGPRCSPFSMQWTFDTWTVAHGIATQVVQDGGRSWFFITTDYAFGLSLERSASEVVRAQGGKVVGGVRYPSDTTDFSSYLIQAQASGADVIGLATNTAGAENIIKQAREFGIDGRRQRLTTLLLYLADVHALGLQVAQGILLEEAYYWDQNDAMRAYGERYFNKVGRMPTQTQAAPYSAVSHWLKAVAACGTSDGPTVTRQMQATPVNDFMTTNGQVRPDGRLARDMYIYRVKSPAESKKPWDYYTLLHTIPAAQATRPLSEGGCTPVSPT